MFRETNDFPTRNTSCTANIGPSQDAHNDEALEVFQALIELRGLSEDEDFFFEHHSDLIFSLVMKATEVQEKDILTMKAHSGEALLIELLSSFQRLLSTHHKKIIDITRKQIEDEEGRNPHCFSYNSEVLVNVLDSANSISYGKILIKGLPFNSFVSFDYQNRDLYEKLAFIYSSSKHSKDNQIPWVSSISDRCSLEIMRMWLYFSLVYQYLTFAENRQQALDTACSNTIKVGQCLYTGTKTAMQIPGMLLYLTFGATIAILSLLDRDMNKDMTIMLSHQKAKEDTTHMLESTDNTEKEAGPTARLKSTKGL